MFSAWTVAAPLSFLMIWVYDFLWLLFDFVLASVFSYSISILWAIKLFYEASIGNGLSRGWWESQSLFCHLVLFFMPFAYAANFSSLFQQFYQLCNSKDIKSDRMNAQTAIGGRVTISTSTRLAFSPFQITRNKLALVGITN